MGILSIFYFLTYFTSSLWAQEFVQIELKNGEVFEGERVHTYEARWFWQKSGPRIIALAPFQVDPLQLRFFDATEIKKTTPLKVKEPSFLQQMQSEKLLLKRLPLDGEVFISTGHSGHHRYENMYGDFAWDLLIRKNGKTMQGPAHLNQSYHVFGESIFSPVDGVITEVYKQAADNIPDPTLTADLSKKSQGNYMVIHLKGNVFFALVHFQQGSIPKKLRKGYRVRAGEYLGRVGNSGVSYLPHLHITTYYWSEELGRMVSIPNMFSNLHNLTHEGDWEKHDSIIPKTHDTLHNPSAFPLCRQVY